jgi:hypothetical protein
MSVDFQQSIWHYVPEDNEFFIATAVRTANHSISIIITISVPKIDSMGEHKLDENKCLLH